MLQHYSIICHEFICKYTFMIFRLVQSHWIWLTLVYILHFKSLTSMSRHMRPLTISYTLNQNLNLNTIIKTVNDIIDNCHEICDNSFRRPRLESIGDNLSYGRVIKRCNLSFKDAKCTNNLPSEWLRTFMWRVRIGALQCQPRSTG